MKKHLTIWQWLLLGGTLFSMHFGSSCLLYPVTWGKEAGRAVGWVYAGIFLSGVLLPFLGYLALARGKGDFLELVIRAVPRGGRCFVLTTILLLGPVYVVPRMTAAAWEALAELLGEQCTDGAWTLAFHAFFYPAMFWFAANKAKIAKRVGGILFPILLCIVKGVIGKGLLAPVPARRPPPEFIGNPFLHGVCEGYATGDLPCALIFGLVVLQSIRQAGISSERMHRSLLCVSALGLGLLALAHLGHMLVGANLGESIQLTLAALYTRMVLLEWGQAGGMLFAVVLTAATLTCGIGCLSSTAQIGARLVEERASYRAVCGAFCAAACIISCTGLNGIVTFVGPILSAFYPPTIALALYYALMPPENQRKGLLGLRLVLSETVGFGILELIHVYLGLFQVKVPAFNAFYARIPLAEQGFAWLPLAVLLFGVTWFWQKKTAASI